MPNAVWDPIMDRAIEWREIASKQEDPFLKFVIEYIAFNALIRARYGYEKPESYILYSLKKEIPNETISTDKIEALKEIAPINNVRNIHRNRGRRVLYPEDLNNLGNVIEAVYWARNNLFHGDKRYSFEKDQKLVKVAYEILVDINDWLVSENSGGG